MIDKSTNEARPMPERVADEKQSAQLLQKYRKPELVRWGTITELTRGPGLGFQDFFMGGTGGTQGT